MNTTDSNMSDLVADMAFQPRVGLDDDHVEGMVRALDADLTTFENKPIQVWRIGGKLFIVDGHHRFAAFTRKRECFAAVPVVIHETQRAEGMSDDEHVKRSRSDALQHAITANNHHGSPLKRSRADNRRAVELVLDDPITRQLSDAAIAEMVGVSAPTVASIRKSNPEYQVEHRKTKDGRVVSRDRQASGADKRKKTEPQDTAAVEPELPVAGVESVTSVSVRELYDEQDMTPEQIEERRRKFLDDLFDVERLLSPDFDVFRDYPRDNRGKLIPINSPFSSSYDENYDIAWIDDRKLCSALLDDRVHKLDIRDELVKELVRRFLKLSHATDTNVVEVSPAVEPEPAADGKGKRPGNTAFDWSTSDGIRDSMRHAKFTKGVRYREWFQRCKVKDKRTRFHNVPDDAALESLWDSISA